MSLTLSAAARASVALGRELFREWKHDNASMLAAAVAFYATFSVAPLLVLSLTIAAMVLGEEAAQREVVEVIGRTINPRTALAVQRLLSPAVADDSVGVTIISAVLLLAAASGVFRHLRVALNLILDVPTAEAAGWIAAIRSRLIAVVMVVAALAVLLGSVALTAVLAAVRNFVPAIPAGEVAVWRGVEIAGTTLIMAGVFAAILKLVPNAKLAWRNVRVAAVAAAVLFGAGRYLLGAWLSRTNITSLYGAAASLFVILVATYFAVLVLFLAAELTEVLARRDEEFTEDRARKQAVLRHERRKPDRDPLEGVSE
ncbi:MAG TPA: YihY/virulence factor BrkB family protein [Thermoanaerobaculia bacterium]